MLICLSGRSEHLSRKFDSVFRKGYTEHPVCLAERPVGPAWACQADIASVHWTKLKHVGMVPSCGLLLLAVIVSLVHSTISVLQVWVDVPYVGKSNMFALGPWTS
jgi:hypothetical protein